MSHILYIEPNRLLADTYASSFRAAGHTVDVCRNAQQAIMQADKRTPDVVVTELQLASHSGVEFLYEFRSYPEWRDVVVIILSHVPPQEAGLNKKNMDELRISNYVFKPEVTLKQLINILKTSVAAGSIQP